MHGNFSKLLKNAPPFNHTAFLWAATSKHLLFLNIHLSFRPSVSVLSTFYPPIFLSIYQLSNFVSVHPFVNSIVCLLIHPSIYLFGYPSTYLSIHLPIKLVKSYIYLISINSESIYFRITYFHSVFIRFSYVHRSDLHKHPPSYKTQCLVPKYWMPFSYRTHFSLSSLSFLSSLTTTSNIDYLFHRKYV